MQSLMAMNELVDFVVLAAAEDQVRLGGRLPQGRLIGWFLEVHHGMDVEDRRQGRPQPGSAET